MESGELFCPVNIGIAVKLYPQDLHMVLLFVKEKFCVYIVFTWVMVVLCFGYVEFLSCNGSVSTGQVKAVALLATRSSEVESYSGFE